MISKDEIITVKSLEKPSGLRKVRMFYCLESSQNNKCFLQIQSNKPKFATNEFLDLNEDPLKKPSVIQLNNKITSSIYEFDSSLKTNPKKFSNETCELIRNMVTQFTLFKQRNLDIENIDKLNPKITKY